MDSLQPLSFLQFPSDLHPPQPSSIHPIQPPAPQHPPPPPKAKRKKINPIGGKQCVVFGCRNNDRCFRPGVSFFRIPNALNSSKFDASLNDLWLRACADPDLEVPSIGRFKVQRFGGFHRICSMHFRPEDVKLGQRNRLRPGAVPVLHLPQSGSSSVPAVPLTAGIQRKRKKLFSKVADVEYVAEMMQVNPEWPWKVMEKSEREVVFCRVRRHRFQVNRLFNATIDYVRLTNTMRVRLFTGRSAVPSKNFAHLLTERRAENHAQVLSLFEFDFTLYDHESRS